ncbi:MAG: DUF1549 domain-containing protein [Verrucomicrobia bacterium]|nr:DUF1549 domain-containing protein [Verrucomicrobiota bacterium]
MSLSGFKLNYALFWGVLLGTTTLPASLHAASPVDFNRDIRPILSENCFQCHGLDEKARKAKLRLDTRENAIAARQDGAAIVPGLSRESKLIERIRRLSLDLIGLPTSIADADEFVRDRTPDAYDKLVDRLLASPAFGEHWARLWLDLARFADSVGYGSDPLRPMWRYRDWVIEAFNRNLPFDQFSPPADQHAAAGVRDFERRGVLRDGAGISVAHLPGRRLHCRGPRPFWVAAGVASAPCRGSSPGFGNALPERVGALSNRSRGRQELVQRNARRDTERRCPGRAGRVGCRLERFAEPGRAVDERMNQMEERFDHG